MGLRSLIFLGLLSACVLIASEVSSRELAETKQIDETDGIEVPQDCPHGGGYGRGGYRGGYGGGGYGGGHGGGGYGGGRCGCYGCCGGGYWCRCCTSASEAEAYATAQAKNKTQN